MIRSTVLLALAAAAPLAAQSFDRTKAPALGPAPALTLPPRVDGRLANGLRWSLVEMHEVPLVQVSLQVEAGARADGTLPGLATFTANMLDEGAGAYDALGLAAQAEFLGATLRTFADWNVATVSVNAPKRTIDEALALAADVTLRPAFATKEVTRQRDLRLAAILQQRDQPRGMMALAFSRAMYAPTHPYHRPIGGDSTSTMRLDSATVRSFWASRYAPDRTHVILTGDLTRAEAVALLERHFGAWRGTAPALPRTAPAVERPAATRVYLVDKPGAAQSVVQFGQPGTTRTAADWAAVEVMNTILGGSFSSRLNTNLRETKGYTYGAGSRFDFQPIAGAWTASAEVRTDVTDSSVVEFLAEFRRLRDSLVGADELARARQYLTLGLAGDFETTGQVAGQIATAERLGLPWQWFSRYQAAISAVTAAQVQAAARRAIDPARLVLVIVGDAAMIRPGLERLGLGPIMPLTLTGQSPAPPPAR